MRFGLILFFLTVLLSASGQGLDSLILKYQQEEDYDRQLTVLSDLVKVTLWNNPDTAAYFAQEFKRVAEENQDTLEMARGLNFEGMIYYFSGTYDKAIAKYLEAYPYFEDAGDQYMVGMMYNNIGAAYSNRFNPERTVEYYEKALEKFEELQDTTWIVNLNHNLANEYFNLGQIERAEELYNTALDGFKLLEDSMYMAYAYSGIGTCLAERKEYQKALDYYYKAVLYSDSTVDRSFSGSLSLNLGQSLFGIGQVDEAEELGLYALRVALEMDERHRLPTTHQLLSSVYQKQGKFEEALFHAAQRFNWNDSIFASERELISAEMLTKFDTERIENELAINELELLEEQRQSELFIAGLIILLLLLMGAVLFLVQYQRNTKKLERKNNQIQTALEEKELLLREIHHRVKNNLQIVSSLLGIQGRQIEDKAAFDAISASRGRVQAMSLIHQNLYTQDNLVNINVKSYVVQLVGSILQTYSHGADIKLHTEIEEIQLDVDTLISLGLIMNELINNSLKHAFKEGESGNLWVKLVETKDELLLEIKDDGVGFEGSPSKTTGSFGMKMLGAFAKKLRAQWSIEGEGGTTFSLWMKKPEQPLKEKK